MEGEDQGRRGDATPSERSIGDVARAAFRSISTFLSKTLRVAVGLTTTAGVGMSAPSF